MILPRSDNALLPRQTRICRDRYGRTYYCRTSAWNNWGRWTVLAVIVGLSLLIFFLFSCITARRRRRLGHAPYRGTGWTLGSTPAGHAPATYTGSQNYKMEQPQQVYGNTSESAPPQYQSSGANYGYYGGQQTGVEVQPPSNTYQPTGQTAYQVYAPPAGPPPGAYAPPAGPPPDR